MSNFAELFPGTKQVTAMVQLNPLPGTRLYDEAAVIKEIVNSVACDPEALQAADVNAVDPDREKEFMRIVRASLG
ncbi:hypothetical protein [Gemmobacter sp. 24YEA27]|uniref:hypothetical protein n=1 Tax=Gemmobacter sp. 24YEA27 TaxID=3040672 RepID=UPI0024B34CF5|nr:hypothetical protein [Gemmobacter sp. 24YEA27]